MIIHKRKQNRYFYCEEIRSIIILEAQRDAQIKQSDKGYIVKYGKYGIMVLYVVKYGKYCIFEEETLNFTLEGSFEERYEYNLFLATIAATRSFLPKMVRWPEMKTKSLPMHECGWELVLFAGIIKKIFKYRPIFFETYNLSAKYIP